MSDLVSHLRAAQEAWTPVATEFAPPDTHPNYTPYACSYHWFRGPDGRAISLDVIRSDDTGKLGLRIVREREDGSLAGFSYIKSKDCWEPMRTDGHLPGDSQSTRPFLSRSHTAIAGSYTRQENADPEVTAFSHVRFELSIHLESPGYGTGQLGLTLSHLVATDFQNVRYKGFVELDEERLAIDSLGSISLHAGDELPEYGYLVSVPSHDQPEAPKILAAAVKEETLRVGAELLGGRAMIYAYGQHGLPPISICASEFGRDFPLGLGARVELSNVQPFVHEFLGQVTCTASADARYIPTIGATVELGRIFLDYRGQHFVRFLVLSGKSLALSELAQ